MQTAPMDVVRSRVRPPLAIVLGSPREVVDLVAAVGVGEGSAIRWTSSKPTASAKNSGDWPDAEVMTAPDLWDLPARFQTVLYPPPRAASAS